MRGLDGAPAGAALTAGFHSVAPDEEWTWTDGRGRIATGGARMLSFRVLLASVYWQGPPQQARRAAG